VTEGVESITTAALSLALDAASLRQQAFAANIANAGTEGYAPLRVSFEAELEEARGLLRDRGLLDAAALSGVEPVLERGPAPAAVAPGVLLDVEVSGMAQNAVHYQALLEALSRHYAVLSAAVNDGKK
jgi:flagellar basal-body rod protein FlgB